MEEVAEVVPELHIGLRGVRPHHLREARDAGLENEAETVGGDVTRERRDELRPLRPRPDEAHRPPDDVKELRELVEARLPEQPADAGRPLVVRRGESRARARLGRPAHRPELPEVELHPVPPHPALPEPGGARALERDGRARQGEKRKGEDEKRRAERQVDDAPQDARRQGGAARPDGGERKVAEASRHDARGDDVRETREDPEVEIVLEAPLEKADQDQPVLQERRREDDIRRPFGREKSGKRSVREDSPAFGSSRAETRKLLAPPMQTVTRDLSRLQRRRRAPRVLAPAENDDGADTDRDELLRDEPPDLEGEPDGRYEDEEHRSWHGETGQEVERDEAGSREERGDEEAAALADRRRRLVVRPRERRREESRCREPREPRKDVERKLLLRKERRREREGDVTAQPDDHREDEERDAGVPRHEKEPPSLASARLHALPPAARP